MSELLVLSPRELEVCFFFDLAFFLVLLTNVTSLFVVPR